MEYIFQSNLILSIMIFAIGAFGFLWKQDALGMFMCIELMLNAGNLAFVTISQAAGKPEGIAAFIFIITVAAAEAGIGLALFIKMFKEKETLEVETMTALKD